MATFMGSIQEFHHFIGPKLRNAVNVITRSHRKQRNGICEFCETPSELQSAHIQGRDRRIIIEQALVEYTDQNGVITGNLEEMELKILQAHLPIEYTFKFICQPCHTRYDAPSASKKVKQHKPIKEIQTMLDNNFLKLHKIKTWAKRPWQNNHKIIQAFLYLEEDGAVEESTLKGYCTDTFKMSDFAGNYASMKTDCSHSNGKVFFNEGSKVKIWAHARKEIDTYFENPKRVDQ